jgi:hypothetical protein
MGAFGGAGNQLAARYMQMYGPAQQEQLDFARNYASPGQIAQNRSMAMGDQAQAWDAANENSKRQLQSYGVDPGSGRYVGQTRTGNIQRGAAEAAAGTQAAVQTPLIGQQLLEQAIQTGQGVAGTASGFAGTGIAAGNQAANVPLSYLNTGVSALGSPIQWDQLGDSSIANWNNAMLSEQNLLLQKQKQDQASSSGIGAMLGGGLGFLGSALGKGGMFASGGALAGLFGHEGGTVPSFARGGTVPGPGPAPHVMPFGVSPVRPLRPVSHFQGGGMAMGGAPDAPPTAAINTGNVVPTSASPSGGAVQDDVPARLEPGEGVIPQDVMRWRGEQWMQKEIEKARKERHEKTVAQPQVHRLPPVQANAPPRFVSEGAAQ